MIADMCMVHLEITLMDNLMESGTGKWYRYIGDTFVLVNYRKDENNTTSIVNSLHSSIRFASDVENGNKLKLLDVQVMR